MKARIVVALLLLGIGGGLLYSWSKGSVSTTQKVQQTSVKGASTDDTKTLTFDPFSVVVPGRFQLKTDNQSPQKPLLVQQLYIARDTAASILFGDQLAITAGELPTRSLQDVSDVVLRQRSTSYQAVTTTLANTYMFESKTTQYEIGVFTMSEEYYVGVVLSGPLAKQEQLKKELETISTKIIWR